MQECQRALLNRDVLMEFYLLNMSTYNLESSDKNEFKDKNLPLRSL